MSKVLKFTPQWSLRCRGHVILIWCVYTILCQPARETTDATSINKTFILGPNRSRACKKKDRISLHLTRALLAKRSYVKLWYRLKTLCCLRFPWPLSGPPCSGTAPWCPHSPRSMCWLHPQPPHPPWWTLSPSHSSPLWGGLMREWPSRKRTNTTFSTSLEFVKSGGFRERGVVLRRIASGILADVVCWGMGRLGEPLRVSNHRTLPHMWCQLGTILFLPTTE